jgi:inhibitor of KinA sporulation pathway (predicted exonuclease)
MNYIVLDLEWNQCPSGKKHEDPTLPFEIIEIGAVKLSADFRPLGSYHEIIQPEVYKKLHYITRNVINLKEHDLQGKRSFPEVFRDFSVWCGEDYLFSSWGSSDLPELQRNVAWHQKKGNLDPVWPFAIPLFYRDVQKLFSIVHEDGVKRRSLEWAVEYLKLDKKEKFHDAFSDAVYTSRILAQIPREVIDQYVSVDTFKTPRNREEEILLSDGSCTRFISRSFKSQETVMRDRLIAQVRCPICGGQCHKKIDWFQETGKNLLCAADCPEHRLLKGKVHLRQNGAGRWFAIKTIETVPVSELDLILKRQESARKRQRLYQKDSRQKDGRIIIS